MKKSLMVIFLLLFAMAGSASLVSAQVKEAWEARYNGPANDRDIAKTIKLDAEGNAYVTGQSCGMGSYPSCLDYATIKYDFEHVPPLVET